MEDPRAELCRARRIVVKVGSRVLANDPDLPGKLARQIAELSDEKRTFVVVSSGSIALGCERLGYAERPKEAARLQAAAAVGQGALMRRYDEAFAREKISCAQVLLTYADLANRMRVNNARQALAALIEARVVPVINENDVVATDELRLDNDQLAAMVAPLVAADLLVLLTDVEGVLDHNAERIGFLTPELEVTELQDTQRSFGSGGIQSKLVAAHKASQSGAWVVIASAAQRDVLSGILSGQDIGTLLPRVETALRARKHWIAYTLRPRGTLILDAGAVAAVAEEKRSLLPVGVLGVRGQFNPGDAVRLVTTAGTELGRGLTRLGAVDVARAAGKRGSELEVLFGNGRDLIVVHRDDLVLTL